MIISYLPKNGKTEDAICVIVPSLFGFHSPLLAACILMYKIFAKFGFKTGITHIKDINEISNAL